jgi:hypothetical protein
LAARGNRWCNRSIKDGPGITGPAFPIRPCDQSEVEHGGVALYLAVRVQLGMESGGKSLNEIRFAMLAAACLRSGCAAKSASTNSSVGDEVWLLPWGLAKAGSGSSKENMLPLQ